MFSHADADEDDAHLFLGMNGKWHLSDSEAVEIRENSGWLVSTTTSSTPINLKWKSSNGHEMVRDDAVCVDSPLWLNSETGDEQPGLSAFRT